MKKLILLSLIVFGLTSCGGIKCYTDYDKGMDFSKYTTFGFYADMNTGLSQLDAKRFKYALTATLQDADYTLSETPDFKINFYSKFYETDNHNTIGIGIGSYGGNVGGGVSGGIPIGGRKQMLSLTIEFINAKTDQLFWQGVIETKIKANKSPEQRREFFKELAEKALENYPPGD